MSLSFEEEKICDIWLWVSEQADSALFQSFSIDFSDLDFFPGDFLTVEKILREIKIFAERKSASRAPGRAPGEKWLKNVGKIRKIYEFLYDFEKKSSPYEIDSALLFKISDFYCQLKELLQLIEKIEKYLKSKAR